MLLDKLIYTLECLGVGAGIVFLIIICVAIIWAIVSSVYSDRKVSNKFNDVYDQNDEIYMNGKGEFYRIRQVATGEGTKFRRYYLDGRSIRTISDVYDFIDKETVDTKSEVHISDDVDEQSLKDNK